jgi:hypothetical protein
MADLRLQTEAYWTHDAPVDHDQSLWNSQNDSKISPSLVGRSLGHYTLRSLIAQGGMGAVYEAFHEGLKKTVALKTLLAGADAGEEDVKRFLIEGQVLARLDHPNVVPVFDVGEIGGVRYIAMELIRGQTLYDRIRSEGSLEPDAALDFIRQAAEGLQHAHRLGVLHRDLKPANILIDYEGRARLTDFGVAKAAGNARLTATGTALGTPNYMSPEQAMGKNEELDVRTDVYGLGAILYECLTGLPPFNEASAVETMQAVVRTEVVNPRKHNPAIPMEIESLCLKCLRKNRDERFSSAQELVDAIGRYELGDLMSGEFTGTYSVGLPRNALIVGAGAIVVAVLVLGLLVLSTGSGQRGLGRVEDQAALSRTARLNTARETLAAKSGPAALSDLVSSLDYDALERDALAGLDADDSAARDATRRGLGDRLAFDEEAAPLLAQAKFQLADGDAVGLPSAEQLPLLVESAILAPSSPSGRVARLKLAQSLLGKADVVATRLAAQELESLAVPDTQEGLQAMVLLAEHKARAFSWSQAVGLARAASKAGGLPGNLRARSELLTRLAGLLAPSTQIPEHQSAAFGRDAEGPVLFVANGGVVRCYRVNSEGEPTQTKTWAVSGASIRHLAMGDWNGDGVHDLILVTAGGGAGQLLVISMGEHNQPLQTGVPALPGSPLQVATGDVNGDRLIDIAMLMREGRRSFVVLGGSKAVVPLFPKSTTPVKSLSSIALLDLDGDGRSEVCVGSGADAGTVDVRRLDGTGSNFESRTVLRSGPVVSLSSIRTGQQEKLLVVVDWPLGTTPANTTDAPWRFRDGLLVFGQSPTGLKVTNSWSYPGDAPCAPTSILGWTLQVDDELWLSRSSVSADGSWGIDMRPLTDLPLGSTAKPAIRMEPKWTQLPGRVLTGDFDGDGAHEVLLGQHLLGTGPTKSPVDPKRSERAPLDAPGRLLRGARLLRALGHTELSESRYSAPLREGHPSSWAAAANDLDVIDAQLIRAARAKLQSSRAFRGQSVSNANALRDEAQRAFTRAAEAAETLARGTSSTYAKAQAWAKCAYAFTEAGNRPEALRALSSALALDGVPPDLKHRLTQELTALQRFAATKDLALPFDSASPRRTMGILRPLRTRVTERGTTITCSNETTDAALAPIRLNGGSLPLTIEAEAELHGGAWFGVAEIGIFRRTSKGEIAKPTGFRITLSDAEADSLSCQVVIGGKAHAPGYRLERPRGALNLKLTLKSMAPGGIEFTLEVRDETGALLSETRNRAPQAAALEEATLYAGILSPTSKSTSRACVEPPNWPMETRVTLRRMVLNGSRPTPEAVPALWAAHSALARGDPEVALKGYTAVLSAPSFASGQHLDARWYRAFARGRQGTASAHEDLVTVARQNPYWALLRFEDLAESIGDLPQSDRATVAAALDSMAHGKTPQLKAVALNLGGALDTLVDFGRPASRQSRSANAYLSMRDVRSTQRWTWQKAYVGLTSGGRLPRKSFPHVLSLPTAPVDDATFTSLLRSDPNPLVEFQRLRRARAARPRNVVPRLRLAALYTAADLRGMAQAELRAAISASERGSDERRTILIRLTTVSLDLGQRLDALDALEQARTAGATSEQLQRFRGSLGDEPRFEALFSR